MANEAEKILSQFLSRLQRNAVVRKLLAVCVLLALLCVAAYFAYDVMPRQYKLSVNGGEIVSNRHYLAKSLQQEAASHGVTLDVRPVAGSQEALALVDAGKLDLAFIQGGLENTYPHVAHVATIAPELLHVLVKPEIKEIGDLRGKLVNLGSKKGGTRVIAKQALEFSGLTEGIDYVESNIGSEELLSMRADKLPDVIVVTSFAPSDVADYLVKQRGFRLLEVPFPSSLALRLGWVADSKILAYMYNVSPPVPARDIRAIGVNLHLVANDKAEPRAVYKVLESLFNPSLEVHMKMKMDENMLTVPSGFELSEGTRMFIARKNLPFSSEMLDRIQSLFGLLLSVASTVLVVVKWFLGVQPEAPRKDDPVFLDYIGQVAALEKAYEELRANGMPAAAAIEDLLAKLTAIKAEALARIADAKLDNNQLRNALTFVAIFSATVSMWVFSLVDDYIPGMFALLAALITGLVPAPVILSGFASDGFMMALSTLALGTVAVTSGLSYRVMLTLLQRLPDTPFWHFTGLFITGTFLTPVNPPPTAVSRWWRLSIPTWWTACISSPAGPPPPGSPSPASAARACFRR